MKLEPPLAGTVTRITFLGVVAILTLLCAPVPAGAATSSETTPVYFSVGRAHYKVPRNYISQMSNYDGGPQEMVTFKVTYPGFEPLTEKTGECLSSAAEYLAPGPGCVALKFWIGIDGGISDDEGFNNLTRGITGQIMKQGPNGLTLYQYGSGFKRMDIYRKKTASHNLFVTCDYFDNHGTPDAVCTNYDSPLSNGDRLSYLLSLARIEDVEKIDDGIRSLIASFTVKGNTP